MKESEHENQHAPLSYRGAHRIVWLAFLLIIAWLILRSLQPVILLFAIVFLLAMVLNSIVVWLQKRHIPRFASVILLMLALVAVTGTIIVFAIPPLARQSQELVHSAPSVWQGIRTRIESLAQNYPAVREALPRTDEIAGKVGAAAGTLGNILLRSTIGLVGGAVSIVFAILLLVIVLVYQIELNFLVPGVLGKEMRLHPVNILFFTLATATMFGLLGVILAVPAAALVQIVIDEFYLRPRNPDYTAIDREAAALVEGKS